MSCRLCHSDDLELVLSLGTSPLANSNVTEEKLKSPEVYLPLNVLLCKECLLVQLEDFETPENLFSDYDYFSSWSSSWLAHAKRYVDMMTERFAIDSNSHVVEIASNDGYLLKNFVDNGVPVTGVEPAENVAKVAIEAGVPTISEFWTTDFARNMAAEGKQADLILGNNVLAHVPDLNDFVGGMKVMLKPEGVITMEFPHLYQLVDLNQFDTIYHEHFSYLSFLAVQKVFAKHGLEMFDVQELPTHGGSLRIFAKHEEDTSKKIEDSVDALLKKERDAGMFELAYYAGFGERINGVKRDLLEFLINAKREGKTVVGYGAPAKGNTLLNYAGIRSDLVDYTVDLNPEKQGKYTPGTRLAIKAPEAIKETKPDYVLILPWNLRDEISSQMAHIREWGGKFVVAVPSLNIIDPNAESSAS